jgi:hypothetical protein
MANLCSVWIFAIEEIGIARTNFISYACTVHVSLVVIGVLSLEISLCLSPIFAHVKDFAFVSSPSEE